MAVIIVGRSGSYRRNFYMIYVGRLKGNDLWSVEKEGKSMKGACDGCW